MNSFTHTFTINYLALYIDYLILGFLRRNSSPSFQKEPAVDIAQAGLYVLAVQPL